MSGFQSVLSAASQLPVAERLRLIDALAASVPDDHPPALSAAWLAEIERRGAEVDAGTVDTEDWATIRNRLLGRHGVDGAS